MAEFQFPHIEAYGRRASKRKEDGRSMLGVAREAERVHGYCDHVSDPKPPKILFGCKPTEAVRIARERAEQAVDGNGDRLRIDGLVFLGGVASYPAPWTKIRGNKAEADRLRRWLGYLLEHLKSQYGVTLHYVLLHEDEKFPHAHWGCIPELEAGKRLRISSVHPGRAAYARERAAGGSNKAGQHAYDRAMVQWQDEFHIAVYAKVGIARIGPKRQRLTPSERKAREKAETALARTLEAEKEIKAKWRAEIRAEIEQSFAEVLMHQERTALELQAELQRAKTTLADRKAEIAELQREIAELRAELSGPDPLKPAA